jgi:penicillin-binding protein 1A
MPLWVALAKSINTIPVKMSITIGKAAGITHEANAAKYGRAKIVELARRMGLTTPLTDTVSLPIGASEVYVIDQAAGYAVFANGGKKATPYAAIEIRNSKGETIYRRDRDGPEPEQVLSSRVVADMNFMLAKVNEEGTGKRAALEGIRSGGKTGTTNDYHDAWYIGFTGNYVAAVWYGNDDYSSTARMTGGTLPAMTWHEVMAVAHQNVEIKPIPGLEGPGAGAAQAAKGAAPGGFASVNATGSIPGTLSRRSFEVIGGLGDLFRTVERPTSGSVGFTEPTRAAANAAPSESRPAGGRIALP